MYASLSIWPCLLTCTMGPVLSFLCTFCVCVCPGTMGGYYTHPSHAYSLWTFYLVCVFEMRSDYPLHGFRQLTSIYTIHPVHFSFASRYLWTNKCAHTAHTHACMAMSHFPQWWKDPIPLHIYYIPHVVYTVRTPYPYTICFWPTINTHHLSSSVAQPLQHHVLTSLLNTSPHFVSTKAFLYNT